jgi:alanyl-tRNA synthetase
MHSDEIRKRFLNFFKERGHTLVPSSPLLPENDPSVLFTTAGMQQFKPYYTGKDPLPDFGAQSTTSVQKCVRTSDIDEVGDATHLTFFEMLGNFSFGGYGRREAITYAHDFITKELNLPISYVTFYRGEGSVPRDEESAAIWRELGVADVQEDGSDVFWGPTGNSGPCGPTTEIYCKNAAGQDVEIWNVVFNEYFCTGSREELNRGEAKLEKLPTLGIDTGMGLERLLATVQNAETVFETDVFVPLIAQLPDNLDPKIARIIADHLKTAVFLIADGARPSNKEQGYVLRRLLRRAFVHARINQLPAEGPQEFLNSIIDIYKTAYPDLDAKREEIIAVVYEERQKFGLTLEKGLKELKSAGTSGQPISGEVAFDLYQTYGIPFEVVSEFVSVSNPDAFTEAFKKHQDLSRSGADQKFKGGLADTSEQTLKYHTATHLLNQALHDVLGDQVEQRGSNITPERLRFDFTHHTKLTDDEKSRVEAIVNEKILLNLPVQMVTLPKAEALKTGARHAFNEKYGEEVHIYFIGDELETAYSKEFCGGPHVANTGVLGKFKIAKEEAVAAGIRRIKAVLE